MSLEALVISQNLITFQRDSKSLQSSADLTSGEVSCVFTQTKCVMELRLAYFYVSVPFLEEVWKSGHLLGWW